MRRDSDNHLTPDSQRDHPEARGSSAGSATLASTRSNSHGQLFQGLLVALLTLIADQATKWIALKSLVTGGVILIPGFFDLILVKNHGAAFGILTDADPSWRDGFLIVVAIIAIAIIIQMLRQESRLWNGLALGMVMGGAVGNLVDRMIHGWVVDFIHLHWHDLSWPVFNLADSAITVGIGMLLWDNFKNS